MHQYVCVYLTLRLAVSWTGIRPPPAATERSADCLSRVARLYKMSTLFLMSSPIPRSPPSCFRTPLSKKSSSLSFVISCKVAASSSLMAGGREEEEEEEFFPPPGEGLLLKNPCCALHCCSILLGLVFFFLAVSKLHSFKPLWVVFLSVTSRCCPWPAINEGAAAAAVAAAAMVQAKHN